MKTTKTYTSEEARREFGRALEDLRAEAAKTPAAKLSMRQRCRDRSQPPKPETTARQMTRVVFDTDILLSAAFRAACGHRLTLTSRSQSRGARKGKQEICFVAVFVLACVHPPPLIVILWLLYGESEICRFR
jgi:hypothetical protein